MFEMSFDPQSLSEIARFAGFPTYLSDEVQQALSEAGSLLVASAQANMNWKNGTGALLSSIAVTSESPYEVIIGSDLPYARRREYGFTGLTDSLGRTFKDDPGAFYMTNAMQDNQSAILASVDAGVERALNRLAQG
jgi:hypothetical protein